MSPEEKAQYLLDKFNGKKITPEDWEKATPYAKKCLVQKANITIDEILKIFDGLVKLEYCKFDAIGERKFTFDGEYKTHMTGYDMIEYWREVKKILKTKLLNK
jgi:hypothetical protein